MCTTSWQDFSQTSAELFLIVLSVPRSVHKKGLYAKKSLLYRHWHYVAVILSCQELLKLKQFPTASI